MNYLTKYFQPIKKYALAHKFTSLIIILIVLIGGYYTYKKIFPTIVVPQYTLSPVRIGTITQTVTGTGQVSAENQLDVTSQVSGEITSIPVSVGQSVSAGDVIAKIDSSDALISLQNAQVAYEKLTEPAKPGDIADAQNNLAKAYSDGYGAVSSIFAHVPTIMSGLKSMLYDKSGFLSDQAAVNFSTDAERTYQGTAGMSYDTAASDYANILVEYQNLSKTSATSSIETMISDTYSFAQEVNQALKDAQSAVTYISVNQPTYNPSGATTAASDITNWLSQENSDYSSLLTAKNSIDSDQNALQTLITGADPLDVQAQRLALETQQDTYNKYTIRAPFDGVIGRIPVSVYGQAGASTVIATIIGNQKIAAISLNEVDAAKVAVGQPVMITFDAIDGLNATGTVQEVDQVGAVSSGVVSYGVKITINTSDPRIKPGMSVNTTIVTKQTSNVLVVPTAAVKTLGKTNYVQVLDIAMASSTRQYPSGLGTSTQNSNTASTTRRSFTGTGQGGQAGTGTGAARTGSGFTISSSIAPRKVTVVTGDSDDTNTQIVSGLNPGQLVITKIVTASAAQTTTAPSILSTLGAGGRGGVGGGAARTGTAAPAGGARVTTGG